MTRFIQLPPAFAEVDRIEFKKDLGKQTFLAKALNMF
jgi:hypothetical protein